MNILTTLPTRVGPDGDVARRLVRWMGPALRAADDSAGAAVYLALGATIATTRAFTVASLAEVFPTGATDTLPRWEASLRMLSGEGASVNTRRAAVTARWRSSHAGPTLAELTRTVRSVDPAATLLEVAMADVAGTDPMATQRLVVLLADDVEADLGLRTAVAASLAIQAPGHVSFSIGRGEGPDLDEFRCDDPDSVCDRDLLAF